MATTTDLGNVNIFSSLASFNSNKANLKSNDLNFIKQTAAEMATVGGGIVDELLEENGYVKFANGLILQWGYNNQNPITFPISFPRTVLNVVPQLQVLNDSGNMSKNRVAVTNLTTSGFSIQSPQGVYNWIAVGV